MQADIGIGFLIAVFVSWFFGVPISTLLVLVSVGAALLPDIDFLVEYFRHGSVGGVVIREHRELLHFPLTFIPFIALIWIFFGALWGTVFLLGTICHFLHDTVGIGWGIKWLWPFGSRSYKFFSDYTGRPSAKFLHSWSAAEMPEVAAKYGVENWIQDIYLKPFTKPKEAWFSTVFITESLLFVAGLVVLVVWTL